MRWSSKRKLRWLGSAFAFALALGLAVAWQMRGRNSPPIPPRGGEIVPGLEPIDTPFYFQRDARWKDDPIGGSGETLGKVGCTVASLAMALHAYGISFTPAQLNASLKTHGGYNWRGWLKWDTVRRISGGSVAVEIVPRPAHGHIDNALKKGQPVMVKVFINHLVPHWVLVVGKQGEEYLMRDPLGDGQSLKPLSSYESDIYGVRIIKAAH